MHPHADDTLSYSGASRLAAHICTYWRSRGYPLIEAVVTAEAKDKDGCILYCVRSNISPRGYPPE